MATLLPALAGLSIGVPKANRSDAGERVDRLSSLPRELVILLIEQLVNSHSDLLRADADAVLALCSTSSAFARLCDAMDSEAVFEGLLKARFGKARVQAYDESVRCGKVSSPGNFKQRYQLFHAAANTIAEHYLEEWDTITAWDDGIDPITFVAMWQGIQGHFRKELLKLGTATAIAPSAFHSCYKLALTTLPPGIARIGSGAFGGCSWLALTALPQSLIGINSLAFAGCSCLALTKLPDTVTYIDEAAFRGCANLALTSLPSGLEAIYESAFYACTRLALSGSLPDGLTMVGDMAFGRCDKLSKPVKLALDQMNSHARSLPGYKR